ncbi:MAG TPA: hypothetical protein VNB24_04935 [Acidimicrobiales bacterium]|nr:hypothetical protein [Acidimicrobiales bacterium]
MHPKPHRGTRLLAGVALVALVSGACVKSDPPGVSISEVKTSAKFGFEEKDKKLADFDVPQEDTAFAGATELPTLPELPPLSRPTPRAPAVRGNPDCPEAQVDAFPKDFATVQVKGQPTEGTYKWKRDLVVKVNRVSNPKNPFLVQQGVPETRFIRRVTKSSTVPHEFRFEMVAPDATTSNVVITSFLVNNNPALVANERVDARTIGVVDVPGYDLRVPPPNDMPGVYITKIENKDAKNATVFSFSPVRPMLILPLEEGIIRTGQTFSSYGVDPTTGDVLANEGNVGRTSRVDACGEVVEGYSVTLDQSYTRDVNTADPATELDKYGARQLTRTLHYVFAPQYGLLPIAENLSIGELTDQQALIVRRSLAGLKAEPLPPSIK